MVRTGVIAVLGLVALLLSACQGDEALSSTTVGPTATTGSPSTTTHDATTTTVRIANGEIVAIGAAHHGAVDGVDFTRYECRFRGMANAIAYERLDGTEGGVVFDVGCSLILPTDPNDWNRNVLVEPLDILAPTVPDGEVSRFLYIGEDLIFGGEGLASRSGYASIGYQGYGPGDHIGQDLTLDENRDSIKDLAASTVEILADFTTALREGVFVDLPTNLSQYGYARSITATGLSNQAAAIRGAMLFGETHGFSPFDVSMPMAVPYTLTQNPNGRTASNSAGPVDFGSQKALFVNTETEVIMNWRLGPGEQSAVATSAPLRAEADDASRYVYEIAGAAHIDPLNQQDLVRIGVLPPTFFDSSSPLDWSPIRRAVFVQMNQWLTDGKAPEPSRYLNNPPDLAAPDPAYTEHARVPFARVARDSNNNALGGISHPNVQLGVGTYLAVGPPTFPFFAMVAGGFIELFCGEDASHAEYVQQFADLTDQLVSERFILPSDAEAMKAEADSSTFSVCG